MTSVVSAADVRIEPLDQHSGKDWDDLVDRSDDAWCFNFSEWLALGEFSGLRSLSFLVRSRTGDVLGIFPLALRVHEGARGLVTRRTLLGGGGRAGPALAPGLGPEERAWILDAMFARADRLAEEVNADAFFLALPSLAPAYHPSRRPAVNPTLRFGFVVPPRYGQGHRAVPPGRFLRLSQPREEIWRGLSDRSAINQALRGGVRVEKVEPRYGLASYYPLHLDTCRRTGAIPLPEEYFRRAWSAFASRDCFHLFLATSGSDTVAGLIVLAFKGGASYWAGCARASTLALRPNDLLQWEAIQWAREQGYEWYELGPHFPYLPSTSKMRTIGRFKAKFGGIDVPYFEGIKVYRRTRWYLAEALDGVVMRLTAARRRLRRRPPGAR